MSFSDLGDTNKQRLGAAFFNITDQKSAMSKDKIDWDSATTDITANAREISSSSFQTSITRMKKDWSKLSPADRNRLGACFFHLNADYRKSIMGKGINWTKAAKDFKPDGKAISAASFRTSITRLLINYTPGPGVNMGTPARKRKAASTTASPAPDTSARKRTKTARATSAAVAAAAAESNDTEGPEDANEDNNKVTNEAQDNTEPQENDNNKTQANNETQDNDNEQVDEPSDETPVAKTEPQGEWLGGEDMFGGDSTSDYLQSFMPVS